MIFLKICYQEVSSLNFFFHFQAVSAFLWRTSDEIMQAKLKKRNQFAFLLLMTRNENCAGGKKMKEIMSEAVISTIS